MYPVSYPALGSMVVNYCPMDWQSNQRADSKQINLQMNV